MQKGKQSGPEGNILLYELAERALDSQVTASIKEHISQVSLEIKFIMVLYLFMVRYTFVALSEICLSVHASSPQGFMCFWITRPNLYRYPIDEHSYILLRQLIRSLEAQTCLVFPFN